MIIAIQGPPGSGHRLLKRMLEAAPEPWVVKAFHLPGQIVEADRYVLPWRSSNYVARSILKERMVRTLAQARGWVDEANKQQHQIIESGKPYLTLSYEALVTKGSAYWINALAGFLEVESWEFDEEIYNANQKYFMRLDS